MVQAVVEARGVDDDAAPLAGQAVVGQVAEEFIGAVAPEHDGLLQGAVDGELSVYVHHGLAVEVKLGALSKGQSGIGGNAEAVVDKQGAGRLYDGVSLYAVGAEGVGVLGVCCQLYFLPVAVEHEEDGVLHQGGRGLSGAGQRSFYEYVQAVTGGYFHVAEVVSLLSVHVYAEPAVACQVDGADKQCLVLSVIYLEQAGGGRYVCQHRVQLECVA